MRNNAKYLGPITVVPIAMMNPTIPTASGTIMCHVRSLVLSECQPVKNAATVRRRGFEMSKKWKKEAVEEEERRTCSKSERRCTEEEGHGVAVPQ